MKEWLLIFVLNFSPATEQLPFGNFELFAKRYDSQTECMAAGEKITRLKPAFALGCVGPNGQFVEAR